MPCSREHAHGGTWAWHAMVFAVALEAYFAAFHRQSGVWQNSWVVDFLMKKKP
jgi:hypothetical protein